jgi:hypothetical protein
MDGLLRCTRYAFGPNRLHYCGPDANAEIAEHFKHGDQDPGLAALLSAFKNMFPYLKLIAAANGIADPFDERVVEAYWLGNQLLDNVGKQNLYVNLTDVRQFKKKIGSQNFQGIEADIALGAVPHHSFHVLEVWRRTGFEGRALTLQDMDSCRVSWGRVVKVDGPAITVSRQPLEMASGKLILGAEKPYPVTRALEAETDIEQLQPGQIVSIHWGVPCEVISPDQVAALQKYTLKHLALANQTI